MEVPFSKYSGCGNDFILFDNREKLIRSHTKSFIYNLCHRQNGIGADGVIFLESSEVGNFRMRIFNSDGSEAEMCGNGIRCITRFIVDLGIPGEQFHIETMCAVLTTFFSEDKVCVKMMQPHSFCCHRALDLGGTKLTVHSVDTGVPHAVLFVDSLDDKSLMRIAPLIRAHKDFQPRGTNVNFVMVKGDRFLAIRTFERGVERETMACGTGAVAAAVIAAKVKHADSPIQVKVRSSEILEVSFGKQNQEIIDVYLSGPAVKIYQGLVNLQQFGLNTTPSFVYTEG